MIPFTRYPYRSGLPIAWSSRRASLAKSKPERQANKIRKKIPLLAELVEVEKVEFSEEAIKTERQAAQDSFFSRQRQGHANAWRRGRKAFFECDPQTQARILKKWNSNRYRPKTAYYFAGIVDIESGAQAKRLEICNRQTEEIRDQVHRESRKQLSLL
tara:strand:- start:352 stop:825 length:474 start_codon:yes stop_codon:yes gene_type:complete